MAAGSEGAGSLAAERGDFCIGLPTTAAAPTSAVPESAADARKTRRNRALRSIRGINRSPARENMCQLNIIQQAHSPERRRGRNRLAVRRDRPRDQRTLLIEFFTVSCLVFIILLSRVNWRFSFCICC